MDIGHTHNKCITQIQALSMCESSAPETYLLGQLVILVTKADSQDGMLQQRPGMNCQTRCETLR